MLSLHAQRLSQIRPLLAWRGLLRGALLSLLLLFAQQGALLHELSHYAPHELAHAHDQLHTDSDLCETCVAFAGMGAPALPMVFVPALMAGLAYAYSTPAKASAPKAARYDLRNRGPPAAL